MIALILTGLIAYQDAPRIKIELPNKAKVLVEQYPLATTFTIQLIASSRNVPETKATHGWRHLLEHLMVKGAGGGLDRRLESRGLFLHAETFRDYTSVVINGRTDKLDEAIEAMREMLEFKVSQEIVEKEWPIIGSEIALKPDSIHFSTASWLQAFGDAGLDSIGDIETIKKATASDLMKLHRNHFAPENLVLAITGNVDLKETQKKVTKILGKLEAGQVPIPVKRVAGPPGRTDAEGSFGESRAARVGSFVEPRTLWTLAAAMSMTTLVDSSVIFTFSTEPGLIVVVQTSGNSGLGLKIDNMNAAYRADLFEVGKNMARNWLKGLLLTTEGNDNLRGVLLLGSWGAKPEDLLEAIDSMTYAQFLEGFDLFGKTKATIAVGRMQ